MAHVCIDSSVTVNNVCYVSILGSDRRSFLRGTLTVSIGNKIIDRVHCIWFSSHKAACVLIVFAVLTPCLHRLYFAMLVTARFPLNRKPRLSLL